LLAFSLLASVACGDSGGGGGTAPGEQPPPEEVFPEKVTTIEIEVDYAPGAEPYTGDAGATGDVWDLFRANAEALFEGRDKTFIIPTTLDEMQELEDVPAGPYDYDEIVAIADAHRDRKSSGSVVTYYVVWLDGLYEKDGSEQAGVLGVSLTGTGIIAMFKPVIESTSVGPLGAVERYVEQATLVHEFGHAVGLVNNGLPLTSEHHDAEHGAHCNNEDCVMYYQVEGASAMVDFVVARVTSGDVVLFADDCLADAAAVE
jgi:hypothetical protein